MNKLNKECIIPISETTDFTIENLPMGIFSYKDKNKKLGMAIGEYVVDLEYLWRKGLLDRIFDKNVFDSNTLNKFIASGKNKWSLTRKKIQSLLTGKHPKFTKTKKEWLLLQQKVILHFPLKVGDYTDFYSSEAHAANVGRLFRKNEDPLLPNWKHMPIAYHGRSSSLMLSGSPIIRPWGQILNKQNEPEFHPTKSLDFELELAMVIGKSTKNGTPININKTKEHIFGFVLLNDWSARDIQRWEYQPLGPFLGKNFATTISPWVVTMEALEPFLCDGPIQNPPVLSYLTQNKGMHLDINLDVTLTTNKQNKLKITGTNSKNIYWSFAQQLAHHTINGCNVNIGDLMASGTISGEKEGEWGSLLEISFNGTKALKIENESRTFIEDGDSISINGIAENKEFRVGFGSLENKVLPAIKME
ncbi:MAG: fumarylacetoacetase [Bacteroidetes bacterium]|nr:fumarylacetoacetase [Bacteroidota bacterium]